MKQIITCVLLLMVSASTFAQSLERAQHDYRRRYVELSTLQLPDSLARLRVSHECRTALEFLYAYMPWPDVVDYSVDYHRQQVECALKARTELPWGAAVPDSLWCHFVLPVRVNNEHLDAFRTVYYQELKQRVARLSMADAALEVNHWCHEHVTYKPSDARTSSPMATLLTATGRCGEESTLTVAALRTVGIPARQVYTPRWAHTDDNHAWVEVWVDGSWHFMGACEPEAVLDLAWFNEPASRGMLMHTKVFGRYRGGDEIMDANPCYTEINLTSNYAPTVRTTVTVTDAAGKPCPQAAVAFKVYNYAEFYTVKRAVADRKGQASIVTGKGDFVVWASHRGRYAFAPVRAGSDNVVLKLTHRSGEQLSERFTLTPPPPHANRPQVSADASARLNRRLAYEDSLRAAYTATFADSATLVQFCQQWNVPFDTLDYWAKRACGNWRNLLALLNGSDVQRTLGWLRTLSDKDLRDFSPAVLRSHLHRAHLEVADALPEAQRWFVYRYIFSPRIADEHLTPWRQQFEQLPEEVSRVCKQGPEAVAGWIARNIADNADWNRQRLPQSPERTLASRQGDELARALLFVSLCRSAGWAARIDPVTGAAQYVACSELEEMPDEDHAQWLEAQLTPSAVAQPASSQPATGRLKLYYAPRRYMENPGYYQHFTLSVLQDGLPVLQNYPETATWQELFRKPSQVAAGDYLLVSGTRRADGSVQAQLRIFPLRAETTLTDTLLMPQQAGAVEVIGSFNSENLFQPAGAGQQSRSLLSVTGRGYYVLALLRAAHEPSIHLLHDLEQQRAELEAWGRPIVLLFSSAKDYERFSRSRADFPNLPATVVFGIDNRHVAENELKQNGLMRGGEQPVLIVADTFNRVVHCTQGYAVGQGRQLLSTIERLAF